MFKFSAKKLNDFPETLFLLLSSYFWSQFGAPGNLGNRAPVEAGARFSSKSRAPCGLRPRRRSGTDSGGILAHFLIDFRGPGGPTTAPRVARSAPRASKRALGSPFGCQLGPRGCPEAAERPPETHFGVILVPPGPQF